MLRITGFFKHPFVFLTLFDNDKSPQEVPDEISKALRLLVSKRSVLIGRPSELILKENSTMKKKVIAALITGVLAAGSAFAQGPYYGGIELGGATVKNQAQDLANTLVRVNGGSSSVTQDTGIGFFRFFGGYNFNKFVAAELGYVQSGYANANFSGVSGGGTAYTGTAKLSFSGFDLSAVIHPMPDSAAKGLFFRAGASSYTQKVEVSGVNITGGSSSTSGTGVNLGVGYDLPVGGGDVRFMYTNLSSVAGVSNNDTNALSVGYLWKF